MQLHGQTPHDAMDVIPHLPGARGIVDLIDMHGRIPPRVLNREQLGRHRGIKDIVLPALQLLERRSVQHHLDRPFAEALIEPLLFSLRSQGGNPRADLTLAATATRGEPWR
jgi:hypothetical protein